MALGAQMGLTVLVSPQFNQQAWNSAAVTQGTLLARNIQSAMARAPQPLGRISGAVSEFEKSMAAANARVLAFGASAGSIYLIHDAFKKIVSSTVMVEKALADINVVLGLGQTALKQFSNEMFKAAANTGQTFETASKVALEFARHGVSATETAKRMVSAMQLMRISGLNAQQSVNAITAAINAFNKEGLTSEDIVNRMTAVDTKFAVSAQDLAKAIERVGSTAVDAGVKFNQLLAMVTAIQTATSRGGAVIGNALKSIFTRVSRPEVLADLENMGIATRNAQGQVEPMITVLKRLSSQYESLNFAQKSFIAEAVGGVYQINILKALMADMGRSVSIFDRATVTAAMSTGLIERRMAMLNETISSKLNVSTANLTRLFSSFGQVGFGGGAKKGLDFFNDQIESIADKLQDFSEDDSFGEKMGKSLAQGLAKGMGDILSGPGVQLITALLTRISSQFVVFAVQSGREYMGLNEAGKRQAAIQQSINSFLSSNQALVQQWVRGQVSLNTLTSVYLSNLRAANIIYGQIANAASGATLLTGGAISVRGHTPATGYIPNFSTDSRSLEKGLAAAHGYTAGAVVPATLYDGRGGAHRSVVNQAEQVIQTRNVQGHRATFVIPPNGFSKNTIYAGEGYAARLTPEILGSFSSGKELLKYIKGQNIQGSKGSSRMFIPIGGGKGVKVALNQAGVAQNELEFPILNSDYFAAEHYSDILPKGFGWDENHGLWGILEQVRKASSKDFKKFTGKPSSKFLYENAYHKASLSPVEAHIKDFLGNYGISEGDFARGRNTGVGWKQSKQGGLFGPEMEEGLKLYDIGFNSDIFRRFYVRRDLGKFGASGFVPNFKAAPRPKETFPSHLSMADMEKNIESYYGRYSKEQMQYWGKAYQDYERVLRKLAPSAGVSFETLAGVTSALSPRNALESNVLDALRYSLASRKPGAASMSSDDFAKSHLASTFLPNRRKAANILFGRQYEMANKTGSFVDNIMFPNTSDAVTVDFRAQSIAYGQRYFADNAPAMTDAQYNMTAQAYRNVAAKMGMSGLEMQAATWVAHRMEDEKALKSARGQNKSRSILRMFYNDPSLMTLQNLNEMRGMSTGKFFGKYGASSLVGPHSLVSMGSGFVPNFAAMHRKEPLGGGNFGSVWALNNPNRVAKIFHGYTENDVIEKEYQQSLMLNKVNRSNINPLFDFPRLIRKIGRTLIKERAHGKTIGDTGIGELKGETDEEIRASHAKAKIAWNIIKPLQNLVGRQLVSQGIVADDFVGHPYNTMINPTMHGILQQIIDSPNASKLAQKLGNNDNAERIATAIARRGGRMSVVDPGSFSAISPGFENYWLKSFGGQPNPDFKAGSPLIAAGFVPNFGVNWDKVHVAEEGVGYSSKPLKDAMANQLRAFAAINGVAIEQNPVDIAKQLEQVNPKLMEMLWARGLFRNHAGMGHIPNFASVYKFSKNPYEKDIHRMSYVDEPKSYAEYAYLPKLPNSTKPNTLSVEFMSSERKGDAFKLWLKMLRMAKKLKAEIYSGILVSQIHRNEPDKTVWENFLKFYPQVRYRMLEGYNTSGTMRTDKEINQFKSINDLKALVNNKYGQNPMAMEQEILAGNTVLSGMRTRRTAGGGFIPNFANFRVLKGGGAFGNKYHKMIFDDSRSYLDYKYAKDDESSKNQFHVGYMSSKRKGDAFSMFSKLARMARRLKAEIVSSTLVPQGHQAVDDDAPIWDNFLKLFPQLRYRQMDKLNTSGSYGHINLEDGERKYIEFKSLDELRGIVEKNFLDNPQAMRKQAMYGDLSVDSLTTRHVAGSGFVPNFSTSPLAQALMREGTPTAAVGFSAALRSPANPLGAGVYDRAYQSSLSAAMQQHRALGETSLQKAGAASGFVPNFDLSTSLVLGGLQGLIGNLSGKLNSLNYGYNKHLEVLNRANQQYEINRQTLMSRGSVDVNGTTIDANKLGIRQALMALRAEMRASGPAGFTIDKRVHAAQAQQYKSYQDALMQRQQRISQVGTYSMLGGPVVMETMASMAKGFGNADLGQGLETLSSSVMTSGQLLSSLPNKLGTALAGGMLAKGFSDAISVMNSKIASQAKVLDIASTKLEKITTAGNGVMESFESLHAASRDATTSMAEYQSLITRHNRVLTELAGAAPQGQGHALVSRITSATSERERRGIIMEAIDAQTQAKNLASVNYTMASIQQKDAVFGWNPNVSFGGGLFSANRTLLGGEDKLDALQKKAARQEVSQAFINTAFTEVGRDTQQRMVNQSMTAQDVTAFKSAVSNSATFKEMDTKTAADVMAQIVYELAKFQAPLGVTADEWEAHLKKLNEIKVKENSLRMRYNAELQMTLAKGGIVSGFALSRRGAALEKEYGASEVASHRYAQEGRLMSLYTAEGAMASYEAEGKRRSVRAKTRYELNTGSLETMRGINESLSKAIADGLMLQTNSKVGDQKSLTNIPLEKAAQIDYLAGRQKRLMENAPEAMKALSSGGTDEFIKMFLGDRASVVGGGKLRENQYDTLSNTIKTALTSHKEAIGTHLINQSRINQSGFNELIKINAEEAAAIKEARFKELAAGIKGIDELSRGGARKLRRELRRDEYVMAHSRSSIRRGEAARDLLNYIPSDQRDAKNPYIKNLYDTAIAGSLTGLNYAVGGSKLARNVNLNMGEMADARIFGNYKGVNLKETYGKRLPSLENAAFSGSIPMPKLDISGMQGSVSEAEKAIDRFAKSLDNIGKNLPDLFKEMEEAAKKTAAEANKYANNQAQSGTPPPLGKGSAVTPWGNVATSFGGAILANLALALLFRGGGGGGGIITKALQAVKKAPAAATAAGVGAGGAVAAGTGAGGAIANAASRATAALKTPVTQRSLPSGAALPNGQLTLGLAPKTPQQLSFNFGQPVPTGAPPVGNVPPPNLKWWQYGGTGFQRMQNPAWFGKLAAFMTKPISLPQTPAWLNRIANSFSVPVPSSPITASASLPPAIRPPLTAAPLPQVKWPKFSAIAQAIQTAMDETINVLKQEIINPLRKSGKQSKIWKNLKATVNLVRGDLSEFASEHWKEAKRTWKPIKKGIQSGWKSGVKLAKNIGSTVWEDLSEFGSEHWKEAKRTWKPIKKDIKSGWKSGVKFVKNVGSTVWEDVSEFGSEHWKEAKRTWKPIKKGIQSNWKSGVKFVKNLGSTVWEDASEFGREHWQEAKRTWKPIEKGIKSGWQFTKDAGKLVWDDLAEFGSEHWKEAKRTWKPIAKFAQPYVRRVKKFVNPAPAIKQLQQIAKPGITAARTIYQELSPVLPSIGERLMAVKSSPLLVSSMNAGRKLMDSHISPLIQKTIQAGSRFMDVSRSPLLNAGRQIISELKPLTSVASGAFGGIVKSGGQLLGKISPTASRITGGLSTFGNSRLGSALGTGMRGLGIGLGAFSGYRNAEAEGYNKLGGTAMGVLTGGADVGSMFGKMGWVQKEGAADIGLGILGAGLNAAAVSRNPLAFVLGASAETMKVAGKTMEYGNQSMVSKSLAGLHEMRTDALRKKGGLGERMATLADQGFLNDQEMAELNKLQTTFGVDMTSRRMEGIRTNAAKNLGVKSSEILNNLVASSGIGVEGADAKGIKTINGEQWGILGYGKGQRWSRLTTSQKKLESMNPNMRRIVEEGDAAKKKEWEQRQEGLTEWRKSAEGRKIAQARAGEARQYAANYVAGQLESQGMKEQAAQVRQNAPAALQVQQNSENVAKLVTAISGMVQVMAGTTTKKEDPALAMASVVEQLKAAASAMQQAAGALNSKAGLPPAVQPAK